MESILHGHPLKPSDVDLAALAGKVGHAFTRVELAVEALTHRGTLDRRPDLKAAFPHGNERLEFLADCMASRYMRPDVEANHHSKESPKCPLHGGNPFTSNPEGRMACTSLALTRRYHSFQNGPVTICLWAK